MTSPVSELSYRPALDGLRAVAVLAVVAYHFSIGPSRGGFLGVDTFFVLSGYLITTLLVRERERTGRIDLVRFWTRRVRRLLPALLVLCLAVAVWAATSAAAERLGALRRDLLSTLLYVANWNFVLSGQSYFDAFNAPSPLRHTWSLAIEEQFYLVWPATVLVLLALSRGRRRLAMLTAALVAGSVAVEALLYDPVDSSRAYYGTDARAHELLVGALLAMLLQRSGRRMSARADVDRGVRRAFVAAGLAGGLVLLAAMVGLSDHAAAYYRGGSLLVSIAVALVILSVEVVPRGPLTALLSLPPAVAVGKVSYGLYLWHWPALVWLTEASTGAHGLALTALRLLVAGGATVASYFIVERPIRRGSLAGMRLTTRRLVALVPVSTGLAALLAVGATAGAQPPPRQAGDVALEKPLTSGAGPTVAVVGDSVAESLLPGLTALARQRDWTLVPAAYPGCSASGGFQLDDEGKPFRWSKRCSADLAPTQRRMLETYRPDVVIWYSARELFDLRSADGGVLDAGSAAHLTAVRSNVEAAFQRLRARGARLVVIAPARPAVATEGSCARKGGRCTTHDGDPELIERLDALLREEAQGRPGIVVVDALSALVCREPSGRCAAQVDGEVLRPDGFHYSRDTAVSVVQRISAALVGAVERPTS